MAKLIIQAAAVIMAICMLVVVPHAEGGITCLDVTFNLLPCESFLVNGGYLPESCCNGVRNLNNAAKTSFDRRTACKCIKLAASTFNINDDTYAMQVPALCNVDIGYPVSFRTDCDTVR